MTSSQRLLCGVWTKISYNLSTVDFKEMSIHWPCENKFILVSWQQTLERFSHEHKLVWFRQVLANVLCVILIKIGSQLLFAQPQLFKYVPPLTTSHFRNQARNDLRRFDYLEAIQTRQSLFMIIYSTITRQMLFQFALSFLYVRG